jgi:NAD(P)-dependent dehydrogenase (short-subunit alcohol dehydrogenase family)
MGRLTGKVAIVTGAAPQAEGVGNGAATAILFAREGAKVVLVNRRADRTEELAERIRSEMGEDNAFAAIMPGSKPWKRWRRSQWRTSARSSLPSGRLAAAENVVDAPPTKLSAVVPACEPMQRRSKLTDPDRKFVEISLTWPATRKI